MKGRLFGIIAAAALALEVFESLEQFLQVLRREGVVVTLAIEYSHILYALMARLKFKVQVRLWRVQSSKFNES